LKVDFLHQSAGSKVAAAEEILKRTNLSWAEVCYMGDDVVDLALLKRAGVGIAVPNGIAESRQAADYVTEGRGGHGAVREVAELILKAQNKWDRIIQEFSK
jgi:3-deoxy-D-manno-octulosonate 8-phosphate phosphatase (KDO 8-P phosphatase)